MKKIRATRLMAMVMAVCMVLALAVPASALTTNYLELKITENESVKPSGTSKVTVTDASGSVLMSDKVTPILVQLLVANFEGDAMANKDGLWDFESDQMGKTIEAGLAAYRESVNAWNAWLDTFAAKGEITGDGSDKSDLVSLLKQDKKVSDMGAVGTSYKLYYSPLDTDVAADDPAKGNTYVFTLTLKQKNTGGGISGGGTGGSAPVLPPEPEKYAVVVSDTANATVIASAMQAAAGDNVSITIKFAEGYVLGSLTVKGDSGAVLATSDFGNNTYIFTMPAEAVTVSVTAKKAGGADHFVDIDPDDWYKGAVDYVVDNDLMSGIGDNKFEPDGPLTRAMVAQIFYNLEGKPAGNHSEPFPDVEAGKWYYDAISWGYVNKVVAGYGDGLYRPDQNVTREELVQIFFNYAKAKGWYNGEQADLTGFSDYENVAPWHKEAVSWGISTKLLSGKGGSKIDPKVESLRCEAAQMLMNLNLNVRK